MHRNQLYKDLTIIITTSPVKSHPSTELLDETVNSFALVDGLNDCNKIIICDGYTQTNKDKNAFKSGNVSADVILNYEKFIELITEKALSGSYKYTTINKQPVRNGFAKNVQICLDLVTTPYVMIVQHDQVFARNINITDVINSMNANSNINYVGMSALSDNDEIGKKLSNPSFKNFMNDIQTEINKDIQFSYYKYRILLERYKSLAFEKKINLTTNDTKSITNVILDYHKIKYGLPLMFLVFWYDKTHICRTEFYKKFIFENVHTNYKTGKSMRVTNFIEDSVGNIESENIKYNGLCAFKNYGSFILYDNPDPAIYHSNGRGYLTEDEVNKLITDKTVDIKQQSGGFLLENNFYRKKIQKYENKIFTLFQKS